MCCERHAGAEMCCVSAQFRLDGDDMNDLVWG